MNELPEDLTRLKFPMLAVVSWKYEGAANNRMPPTEINDRMIIIEEAIQNTKDSSKQYHHAYIRTENNLKEFV